MADTWLQSLRNAQKTCLIQDGRRKVHFTFQDGSELAEEYDVKSDELVVRKWRKKGTLGGHGRWDVEVGEQQTPLNLDAEGLIESTVNPVFIRKDTKSDFHWRIRNMPYPIENYKVIVKPEERNIVISTVNKKYYKKFNIGDMDRCGFPLEQKALSFAHANNTLLVTYKKPPQIVDFENKFLREVKAMKASKDGDVDCTPS